MNRIINAAKLDFHTAESVLRTGMVAIVVPILIGIVAQYPAMSVVLTVVFATYLGGSVFSTHEKNHSDKLYGILPLKKTEMIVGRYLYGLIIGVVSAVIAGILGTVIAHIANATMDGLTFWGALAGAFIYYCLTVSVSYPIYFQFSFAKAYIFTMLPMYLILLGAILAMRRTNIMSSLGQFLRFFTGNLVLLPIFGVLIGLILLVISAVIANLIYTRKEI